MNTKRKLIGVILFDHNIIDGAPAARFLAKFKKLIESGFGIDEY